MLYEVITSCAISFMKFHEKLFLIDFISLKPVQRDVKHYLAASPGASQLVGGKGPGKEGFRPGNALGVSQIRLDNLQVRATELQNYLAAGAAGGDGPFRVSHHREAEEIPGLAARGDGGKEGGAFRAAGQPVRGVLHVAASYNFV